MSTVAIIGGSSGKVLFGNVFGDDCSAVETPYGAPSSPVFVGALDGREVAFLARHGIPHAIAPHRINNRANVWALRELGAVAVIALTTVGAVDPGMNPGDIVVPDQLIDYTWGRKSTFYDSEESGVAHLEMTEPFDAALRGALMEGARTAGVPVVDGGVYACMQGPRFETSAEIRKLGRDGCAVVGMTAMPEAALAGEAGMAYACVSLVVNPAAGVSGAMISGDQIKDVIAGSMTRLQKLIVAAIAVVPESFSVEDRLMGA